MNSEGNRLTGENSRYEIHDENLRSEGNRLRGENLRYEIYDETLRSEVHIQLLRSVVSNFLYDLLVNIFRQCWYQIGGVLEHLITPVCSYSLVKVATLMF